MGAAALAKGLEGNKSLRVHVSFPLMSSLSILLAGSFVISTVRLHIDCVMANLITSMSYIVTYIHQFDFKVILMDLT